MKNIIKSFFCKSNGKFQPPYFWITCLMLLVITTFVLRLFSIANIDNSLLLGALGLVVGWCAVYNMGR